MLKVIAGKDVTTSVILSVPKDGKHMPQLRQEKGLPSTHEGVINADVLEDIVLASLSRGWLSTLTKEVKGKLSLLTIDARGNI